MNYVDITPIMTSASSGGYTVSASSEISSSPAYQAFDNNNNTWWRARDTGDAGWIQLKFPAQQRLTKYSITPYSNSTGTPSSFTLSGSNNGSNWTVVDIRTNLTSGWADNVAREFIIQNAQIFSYYRLNFTSKVTGAYYYVKEVKFFKSFSHLSLVKHEETYKTYSGAWQNVGSTVNESSYITSGIDISTVTESAWAELQGDVEICYWTDDPNKTEVSFTIETEPFTLEDEWDNKEIKVLEYTDNPVKNESIVTLETQPFTIYDEVGEDGNLDILYYTDNTSVQSADLEVKSNYSPLDEINDDFSVIVWTNENSFSEDNVERAIVMEALPKGQLIVNENPIFYGDIKSFVVSDIGFAKYLLSFDDGVTWNVYRRGWKTVDTTNKKMILKYGMTSEELNKVPSNKFDEKSFEGFRIAYYIDETVPESKIESVKVISNANRNDVKFEDLTLCLLNTKATITLKFAANKIEGILDDEDQTKVQYRVLLNDVPYYPLDGEFTRLSAPPISINLNISEKNIIFNQENNLRVEFQDSWGATETWETTFIGSYSGLLFKDPTGQYYSNSFGEILRYLDFDVIIAGQTTLEQKVIVQNKLGADTQNLIIEPVNDKLPEGVSIELSKTVSPFIKEDYLLFNEFMHNESEKEFYVRISTEVTSPPEMNGEFELRAKVDTV